MDSITQTGYPVSPDTQSLFPCLDPEVLKPACMQASDIQTPDTDVQDQDIMTVQDTDTVPTQDCMSDSTQDRLHDIADVIEFCKRNNFPADVVGRWVWIKFSEKPDQDTRDLLKASGFRWVQARMQWAHNCGYYTRKGTANPRWKYGEIPVSEITRDDLRVLKGVA